MSSLPPDQTYRIVGSARWQRWVPIAFLAFIPLVAVGAFANPGAAWFFALWFAGVAFVVYKTVFRTAFRIDVRGEEATFKMTGSSITGSLAAITSIDGRARLSIAIVCAGRKIRVLAPMDNWHDFVNRVEAANPSVELKGV